MSEITPLPVTLELPSTEFLDHEGGLLVRCQKCRRWIPLSDYYSEKQGQLLPLVGHAVCEQGDENGEVDEFFDSGKTFFNQVTQREEPVTEKRKVPACRWSETVRVLEPVPQSEPEGGTLEFKVHDGVNSQDKFGA